jgi:hypothetical protein
VGEATGLNANWQERVEAYRDIVGEAPGQRLEFASSTTDMKVAATTVPTPGVVVNTPITGSCAQRTARCSAILTSWASTICTVASNGSMSWATAGSRFFGPASSTPLDVRDRSRDGLRGLSGILMCLCLSRLLKPASSTPLGDRDVHSISKCKRRDGRRGLTFPVRSVFGDGRHCVWGSLARLI